MTGRLIAVVGPSGVGKDSVMTAVVAHDARLRLARRVITRPSDAGGEDFESVSVETFRAQDASGAFALRWCAHDLSYGIPASVDRHLTEGRDVLANLSRAVLAEAAERFARFEVINLSANRDVLAERLAKRGRETADQINKRLAHRGAALPTGLIVHEIDNSGTLPEAVQSAMRRLYPVRE